MRSWRAAALATALCLVAASACGHRIERDEIFAANGIDPGGANGVAAPVGAGAAGPTPVAGVAAADAPSAAAGASSPAPIESAGPSSATGATDSAAPAAPAAAIGTPGETGPIVIGSVGTFSGVGGALAVPLSQAVQTWVKEVNSRGGLFGRQVQYIRVDDGGDPARHVAALRDLVENRHVVAFVGMAAALTAESGRAYLEQAGVPVIGADCSTTTESTSSAYFSGCSRLSDVISNILRSQMRFGTGRRLAIIYCAEAEPCRTSASVVQAAAPEVGMEVVYSAQTSFAQPDFTAECLNARDHGADVVFPASPPASTVRIAASCARQGYRPQFVNAHNNNADIRTNTGLENIMLSVPTFPFTGSDNPAATEFYAAWEANVGGTPTPYASIGWVDAKMFELAATRAAQATQSINPQSLRDALYTFNQETLGGLSVPLTFSPDGGFHNPSCWWAMQASRDGWTPLNDGQMLCA